MIQSNQNNIKPEFSDFHSSYDAAIYYIRRGLSVIPLWSVDSHGKCFCPKGANCESPGKHPLGKWIKIDDEVTARRIFKENSDQNIGILTDDLIVVDEDLYKESGEGGVEIELPPTLTANTGGGGKHKVFASPADVIIKTSISKVNTAVDVKAAGGYVVASPSKHSSGNRYRWENLETPIAEAPVELVRHILQNDSASRKATIETYGVEVLERYGVQSVERSVFNDRLDFELELGEGTRNDGLFKRTCSLQDAGLPDGVIRPVIHELNLQFCSPPLEFDEVDRTIDSVLNRYPKGDRLNQRIGSHPDLESAANLVFSFREFSELRAEEPEYLLTGLSRGDVCMILAKPNIGKTTKCKNLALCQVTGRPYLNLLTEGEPKRVLYLDCETSRVVNKADIEKMYENFSPEEIELVKDNLFFLDLQALFPERFDLSNPKHFEMLENVVESVEPDIVIIDTITRAFSFDSENDNAEVTTKINKLQQLAQQSNSVVLFTHHIGKAGSEEGNASNADYRGRGASAFHGATYCVIELDKKKSKSGDAITTLNFVKIKGKQPDEIVIELNVETRWFEAVEGLTAYSASEDTYRKFTSLINGTMKRTEIDAKAKRELSLSASSVTRLLNRAESRGDVLKVRHGVYSSTDIPFKPTIPDSLN